MSARILLIATHGGLEGLEIVLNRRGHYVVGRAEDCDICLCGGDLSSVSRHHCELDVDPPGISIRDLGSRNGTFVNEALLGCRAEPDPIKDPRRRDSFLAYELNDGDEVRLGRLVFRVRIFETNNLPRRVFAPAVLS
jgi:serine/threonine-protein kinase